MMSDEKKMMIADTADMIVGGYAYERFDDHIRVVNLNKKDPDVMIFTPDGTMLESSMDPIEESIAVEKWLENMEFMEKADA